MRRCEVSRKLILIPLTPAPFDSAQDRLSPKGRGDVAWKKKRKNNE